MMQRNRSMPYGTLTVVLLLMGLMLPSANAHNSERGNGKLQDMLSICKTVLSLVANLPRSNAAQSGQRPSLPESLLKVSSRTFSKIKGAQSLNAVEPLVTTQAAYELLQSLNRAQVQLARPFQHGFEMQYLAEVLARGVKSFEVQSFYKDGEIHQEPHFIRYAITHPDSMVSYIHIQRSNEMPWSNLQGIDRETRPLNEVRFLVSYGPDTAVEALYINYYYQFADLVSAEHAEKIDEIRTSSLTNAGFKSK